MMRTRRKVRIPAGKSKKIKIGAKVEAPRIYDSDTETDEEPIEEEEMDLAIPENNEDDPLNLFNNENVYPNVEDDHNYISKTAKTPIENRITLRQDLFPSPIKVRSNLDHSSQKLVNKSKNSTSIVKHVIKKKNFTPHIRNKIDPHLEAVKIKKQISVLKNAPLTKSNRSTHPIPEIQPSIMEKIDSVMYAHEDLEDLILPTTVVRSNKSACKTDEAQQSSSKTEHIPIVSTKTFENIKESGVIQDNTIIIDDDNESPSKPQSPPKKPIILKKLRSNEVPEEIKKTKTLPAPTLVSETCAKNTKEKFILPKIVPETDSNVPQKHSINPSIPNILRNTQKSKSNETIIIDDDESASQKIESPSKKTFVLMKVNADEVPEEIKRSKGLKASPLVLLTPAFVSGTSTKGAPVKQTTTLLQNEQVVLNTAIAPQANGNSSSVSSVQLLYSDVSTGNKLQVPTVPRIDLQSNILSNLKKLAPKDSENKKLEGNIRITNSNVPPIILNSSLPMPNFAVADLQFQTSLNQQTSKTGSTAPRISVMNQDDILPSTSNTSNKTDIQKNGMARLWSDLTQASSSDDDDECEGELGLNSLEELQELWELITELYSLNNQTIKALLTKKNRFQNRIKAVEDLLEEALGQPTQDTGGNTSVVEIPTEPDDLKSQEKSKEE